MIVLKVVSIAAYGYTVLVYLSFTFVYLTKNRCMTYHEIALNDKWENVPERYQVLIIALMKTVGGAMLASGLSIGLLAYFAFFSDVLWAKAAVPIVVYSLLIPSMSATYTVHRKTNAPSPYKIVLSGIVVVLVGSGVSFFH